MAESTDPSLPTPGSTPDDPWGESHDHALTPGERVTGEIGNYDETVEMEAIGTPFDEGESDPDAALDDDPSNSLETENASEALSDERFWEIINESENFARAPGGGVEVELLTNTPRVMKMTRGRVDAYVEPAVEAALTEAGVAEVVTITPAADLIADNEINSLYTRDLEPVEGGEPLAVVEYSTLSGKGRYPYDRYSDPKILPERRGGQTSLRWVMVLPESTAAELRTAIIEDPDLVRLMSEAIVTNPDARGILSREDSPNPITRELWERSRPPYEAWKDINGGVERIALRDGRSQPANEARILEF